MTLAIVLFFIGIVLALGAAVAANSLKRNVEDDGVRKRAIHPDVKFGALVIAALGGALSLAGVVLFIIHLAGG